MINLLLKKLVPNFFEMFYDYQESLIFAVTWILTWFSHTLKDID
jgi:hypothetical protein